MKTKIKLGNVQKKFVSKCSENMNITLLIILVLFIVIIIIFAIFKDKTPIMENMTVKDNYDSESILNTTIPTVVFFYNSKCNACNDMIPDYVKLREVYKDNPKYKIAIINCDNNKDFCSTSGVNKFPTIRHYTNPSKKEYKTIFEGGY